VDTHGRLVICTLVFLDCDVPISVGGRAEVLECKVCSLMELGT
jgi:hypothetical protein